MEPKEYSLKSDSDRAFYQSHQALYGNLALAHLNAITKYASMAIKGTFILNALSASRLLRRCRIVDAPCFVAPAAQHVQFWPHFSPT